MQMPLLKKIELKYENLKAQFPKGQASGENITINDSSNLEFDKFNVLGNSFQETSKQGKNLLDLSQTQITTRNGVTSTYNAKEQTITFNGTSTVDNNVFAIGHKHLDSGIVAKKGKTTLTVYYISGSIEGEKNAGIYLFKSNWSSNINISLKQLNSENNFITYTYNDQDNDLLSVWRFSLYEGVTFNNFTIKVMLTEDVDTEYEPFIPEKPSLAFQSDIKSAGDEGNINFKVSNINFFNKNTVKFSSVSTYTKFDDEGNIVSGGSPWKCFENYFSVIENTKYVLVGRINKSGWSTTIIFYNRNKKLISKLQITTNSNEIYKFTTPKNARYIRFNVNSELLDTSTIILKIEDGNLDYIENEEQDISVPVQKPFRSVNENRDTFILKDGKWYEQHKIKRIESYNSEEIDTDYISSTGGLDVGATVDYALDEPELIECNEEQTKILNTLKDLHSYKGTTHIYSEDEVSPIFEIEYSKDLETILKE